MVGDFFVGFFGFFPSCLRAVSSANRMQQVGLLLAGTLDKVNAHLDVNG